MKETLRTTNLLPRYSIRP